MWPPTEEATVLSPAKGAPDAFNAPAVTWTEAWEGRVVVAPTTGEDLTATNRPLGTRSRLTLHFPATMTAPLRGCRVSLRGKTWRVVGAPEPYTRGVRGYRMPVEVEVIEG